jgi:hypothetical protein
VRGYHDGVKRAWVLAVVGACRFEHGSVGPDATTPVVEPEPEPAVDGAVAAFCDPLDPTLVACYQFERNTHDASGHQLDATDSNIGYVDGKVGSAAQFSMTSAADVAESALLDVTTITIEAWIRPAVIPVAGTRAGILDNNGQYGLFLHETGRLQCSMSNSPTVVFEANVEADVWTHVACTYDGMTTTLYVNGVVGAASTGGGTIAATGTTGISLGSDNPPGAGSQLTGLIDEIRIFNVARAPTDICLDAQCM